MNKIKALLIFLCISFKIFSAEQIDLTGKKIGNIPIVTMGTFKVQNGKFGPSNESTYEKRTINGLGGEAMAGVMLGPLFLGAGGEFMSWWQTEDKTKTGNNSLQGKSVSYFGAVGISVWRVLLLGRYFAASTFSVDEEIPAGTKLDFNEAKNSYSLSIIFKLKGRAYFGFDVSNINYTGDEKNGTASTLATDQEMKISTYGISIGYAF